MSIMKRISLVCALLVLFGGTQALAEPDTQAYIEQAQSILSQKNIRDMMDVSKTLKEYGASFQKSLLMPPDLSADLGPGQSVHLLIGAYQFDALYAASFGRKQDAAKAIQSMGTLLNTTNLQSIVSTAALFPPELNWMLREPDKVDIDDVIGAYAANAPKYKKIMADKHGFDVVVDSVYGGLIEGLYIATRSALLMNDPVATNKILAEFQTNIDLVLDLYNIFESDMDYANAVDGFMFLERGERVGWLQSLADFLNVNKGKLTMEHVKAVGRFVSKERMRLLYNEFNDLGFD
ncbi:hypothetical protein [Desulfoplanes sp.]